MADILSPTPVPSAYSNCTTDTSHLFSSELGVQISSQFNRSTRTDPVNNPYSLFSDLSDECPISLQRVLDTMTTQERASQFLSAKELDWNPLSSHSRASASHITQTDGSQSRSVPTATQSGEGLPLREREEAEVEEAKRRSMEDITRGDGTLATRLQAEEIKACLASAAGSAPHDSFGTRTTSARSSPIQRLVASLPVPSTSHSLRSTSESIPASSTANTQSLDPSASRFTNEESELQSALDRLTADLNVSEAEREEMIRRLRSYDDSAPLTLWRSDDGMERGVILDSVDGQRRWQTWRDV